MNPVISREYVEKNYIEKDKIKECINEKINMLREIHNQTDNIVEREIAKGMAVFAQDLKKELLEETEDDK